MELEFQQQIAHPLAVRRAYRQTLEVEFHIDVGQHGYQLPGQLDLVRVVEQRLAGTLGPHLLGVRQDLVQIAVFPEQLDRGLGPDARRSGDVVGGISDQCQVVHDAVRRDAEALARVRFVHPLRRNTAPSSPRGAEQAQPGTQQLVEVLVPRDDDRLYLFLQAEDPQRQRSDDVVGLEALDFEDGVVEGVEKSPDAGEALAQILRHLLPRRLVRGIQLLALARAGVEDHREIVGCELVPDPQQVVEGSPTPRTCSRPWSWSGADWRRRRRTDR